MCATLGKAYTNMHRLSLFMAGVLVLVSAGVAVFFHSRSREDARRIEDAAVRIRELEGQLALARGEISDYREKLREAERIAEDFERQYTARIKTLEARLQPPVEPEPAAEPPTVALVEDDPREAEPFVPGPAEPSPPIESDEPPTTPSAERAEAEAPPRTLERELEEVRTEKRDLEMKYAALVGDKAEGVPLGTVKVTTGLRLKGKVLVVNQRHSFVVIDLGARDGVEKGMVLVLHRGRKFLGKCQVEKVYNRMAAADLMLDWMQGEVVVNDSVRKF